jgi:hypothetical protein
MNCHNVHINIFVHSTYKLDPTNVQLGINTLKVVKELHYYVSNDTSHDTLQVQDYFMLHWKFLQDQGCQLSTLSGMMVALGNSKVTKLGIFSHVT